MAFHLADSARLITEDRIVTVLCRNGSRTMVKDRWRTWWVRSAHLTSTGVASKLAEVVPLHPAADRPCDTEER